MSVLSNEFLNKIAGFVDEQVVSADYTIDSVTRDIGIRRSVIDGTKIKKHVYLTTKDPTGIVTRVRLKGEDGVVLAQLNGRIEHKVNTGRLFEFGFDIKEVTV